jgi:hypothetical protein
MKPSRFRTLLIGLIAGIAYAFVTMMVMTYMHKNVSISYIFLLPIIMGAIPVLFSTKEQLQSYWKYLLMPWGITLSFFLLCVLTKFDGMICLIIIVAPFLALGTLGAFVFRLITLHTSTKKTPLYFSLLIPFLFLLFETNMQTTDQFYTVQTQITINANKSKVWENIKNVKDIQLAEIQTHFVHIMGVPKPLNGELNEEGIGGIRKIVWEKGIKFQERIKTWDEGNSFNYDIDVDPESIPPQTLDDHVMIGGRYFDVVAGGYVIDSISPTKNKVILNCTYRITTNLNFYAKWWADFILNDFNEMILEVIKKRSEK